MPKFINKSGVGAVGRALSSAVASSSAEDKVILVRYRLSTGIETVRRQWSECARGAYPPFEEQLVLVG